MDERALVAESLDPFRYQREMDEQGRPAGWRVAGPEGFVLSVPDKMLALAIGKLLSGKTEEAAGAAKAFLRYPPWR